MTRGKPQRETKETWRPRWAPAPRERRPEPSERERERVPGRRPTDRRVGTEGVAGEDGTVGGGRRMRYLVALVGVLVLASAGVAGDDVLLADAVGRLYDSSGRPICTAFVVRSVPYEYWYRVWVVTAGHCILGGGPVTYVPFRHQPGTRYWGGRLLGVVKSDYRDVAVVEFWSSAPVPSLTPLFGAKLAVGQPLLLSGFGNGSWMSRVGRFVGYGPGGLLMVSSYASPGNSGGPVVLAGTRTVVGVAVATTVVPPGDAPPWVCGVVPCRPVPPYYAVPIDDILLLVRWPRTEYTVAQRPWHQ